MDPWLAAVCGALAASAVWSLVLWRRPGRGATSTGLAGLRRRRAKPNSAAAELVPLVLSPVSALREIVDAAVPEIRSLLSPDGTVAIVFSDVTDSTQLNRRLGDKAWARVLRRHDEAVRTTVREHGGRVVKRQGDGFMAAFHDAASAVAAATSFETAVRRALRQDDEARTERLRLRVGVHIGEVVSERGDYFGTNVVTAARVAGTARPGSVLATDAVVEQVTGDGRFRTRPLRRRRRLRGLDGRHRLHRVRRVGR